MTLNVVTSLNQKLYEAYGRRFVDEFVAHASEDVCLWIVFEGKVPSDLQSSPQLKSLEISDSNHPRFIKFFGHLYEANGVRFIKETDKNGAVINRPVVDFRYNAVRFSFKIFALQLVRSRLNKGASFAWLDADMRCLRDFGVVDLDPFMPDEDQIMSYLGRTKFPPTGPYSECGFLGFNGGNEETGRFLDRMEQIYLSGEIFSMQQWHDSWLWDEVRKEFEAAGFRFKNLSGDAADLEHPFINTGLGKYFDHLKGPKRKIEGHSFAADLRNE